MAAYWRRTVVLCGASAALLASVCAGKAPVVPFSINVSDAILEDLKQRLAGSRIPDEIKLDHGARWSMGVPRSIISELVSHWRTDYNWRVHEQQLNHALPQFETRIGELSVHFAHIKSISAQAMPLMMVHGWTGSFMECQKVAKLLTDTAHGSSTFHLVQHMLSMFAPGTRRSQTSAVCLVSGVPFAPWLWLLRSLNGAGDGPASDRPHAALIDAPAQLHEVLCARRRLGLGEWRIGMLLLPQKSML